jgi:hypothetical protein
LAVEEEEKDRRRKSAQSKGSKPSESRRSGAKRQATPEVGLALRTVYQKTIDEDIPSEMLDLLSKLG